MSDHNQCETSITLTEKVKVLEREFEDRNAEVMALKSTIHNVEKYMIKIDGKLEKFDVLADGFRAMHKGLENRFEEHNKDTPKTRRQIDNNETKIKTNNDIQCNWNKAFMYALSIYGILVAWLIYSGGK